HADPRLRIDHRGPSPADRARASGADQACRAHPGEGRQLITEEQKVTGVRALLDRWRKRGRHWESHSYYPAILDLVGRTALVVGAGKIGEGKIQGLVNGG